MSRRISGELGQLIKPAYRGGRWQKARISAKNVARVRKDALVAGAEWQFERPRKPLAINPVAGHKRVLNKPNRQAEIAAKLENMPNIIEEYRAYLVKSKMDAYANRELHVFYDADAIAEGGQDSEQRPTDEWGG